MFDSERNLMQVFNTALEWLRTAERNWQEIEDEDILMDEPRNDGRWLRPWRQALRDYSHI